MRIYSKRGRKTSNHHFILKENNFRFIYSQRILSTSPPPLIPTTVEQLHHVSTTTPERNQLLEESRILVNDDVGKLTGGDNHNAPLPAIPNTAADDTSNDVSEIGTSSNSEQLQLPDAIDTKSSTFDYLYEFSETRKVLEEFFKCPSNDRPSILENGSDVDSIVSILCFPFHFIVTVHLEKICWWFMGFV